MGEVGLACSGEPRDIGDSEELSLELVAHPPDTLHIGVDSIVRRVALDDVPIARSNRRRERRDRQDASRSVGRDRPLLPDVASRSRGHANP